MITKVTGIEEGVKKLIGMRRLPIPQFSLTPRQSGDYLDTLEWNEQRIPLFDMHYDPRIEYIARYGSDAAQNSALNVYSFAGNDISLSRLIYQELDIAEYILHSRMKTITAFVNRNAANMIVEMESGACANIDLGNTLKPGSTNQCEHRLITTHGMANDRAVGTMTVFHQVNLFGIEDDMAEVYDDDEYYLYGLDEVQTRKARAIHAILIGKDKLFGAWTENDARCRAAVEAVYESDRLGKTVSPDGKEIA